MLDFFRVVPKKRKVKIRRSYGVIYNNPPGNKRLLFYFSTLIFVGSITYLFYLYTPLFSAIYRYKTTKPDDTPAVTVTYPESTGENKGEYMLQIPKILALSRVVANVSPFDANEYKSVLKNDVVAQAKGSSPPGSGAGKSTYIFAHSTQQGLNMVNKNAVFYLLGELQNGDRAYIGYEGKEYVYTVYDKRIVKASDISYLTYSDPSREVLVLQTCWPIGTDWERLIILAERRSD